MKIGEKMKLTIGTNENKFIFDTDGSIGTIFIEHNNTYFFKKDGNCFSIEASEILNLLKYKEEDRAKIFFTTKENSKNFEFILNDELDLTINQSLSLKIDEETITLYITLNGELRFISNQPPSASSYFIKSTAENIYTDKENLLLKINIVSKLLPVSEAHLIIKNRKSKNFIKLQCDSMSTKRTNNFICSSFIYKISVSDLLTILDHNNFDLFDATVLDTFISPSFFFTNTTVRNFKIERSNLLNEETWFKLGNYHMLLKNYGTHKFNNLAFRTSFLTNSAFDFYSLIKKNQIIPLNKTKKIILISEYPHKAQDNGLHLFNYLNENHSDTFDTYYVITQNTKDLNNLNAFKNKVLFFKSKEHFLLSMNADIILHTHSSNYALPLITSFMDKYYQNIKKIFLQHGIIGERDLEYLYGKKSNPNFTNKFIVSSKREAKIVKNELGYDSNDILLTGLARFDLLLDNKISSSNTKTEKKILIMPSWRQGEDSLSDIDFLKTDFFKEFNDLLKDDFLVSLIKNESVKVSFYLHTNFQKYNHLFDSEHIEIIKEGSYDVQTLLKTHDILITDFSSVGLDFSLLNKPVLYYQFDNKLNESRKNNKRFLPGPIFNNRNKLFSYLTKKLKKPVLSPIYAISRKRHLYFFNDTKARERIVCEITKLLH